MDLLSLLAKLTLDSSDFTSKLDAAQQAADGFTAPVAQPLKVDTQEFKDDLDDAEGEATKFQQFLDGAWDGIKAGLKAAGIGTILGKIVLDLGKAIKMTAQLGDEVDKGASRMGVSRKTYQEWGYALEKSGGSIRNLEEGLRKFDTIVGNGVTEEQQEQFEKLGIEAEKAASAEELMIKTLNAIADYSGDDKGVLLRYFFGNRNDELNTLIANGSEGIQDLIDEANEIGLVMSDKEIDTSIRYMDATEKLQNSLESIRQDFAIAVLPVITDAVEGLTRIVAFFSGLGGNKSLADVFAEGDKEFAEQLLTIEGTGAAAEALADKLLGMGETSQMTAEQYEVWKGTADQLIKMIPSLGEVIDTETGQINTNSEGIKENIKQWENLAKQKALQTLKEQKYSAIVEKNQDLIDKSIEANTLAAEADVKRKEAIENLNAVLEKAGVGPLGAEATAEEIGRAQASAILAYGGDEYTAGTYATELAGAVSEFASANAKAADANKQVEELTAELEAGKQEYETWLAAAEEMYGGLDSDAESATAQAQELKNVIDSLPGQKKILLDVQSGRIQQYAIGSKYVPFDQLAYVHRGEEIRTATEVRRNESDGIDYGQLEDRIEAAIRSGMENASVNAYMDGRRVSAEVNRSYINEVKGRRFGG